MLWRDLEEYINHRSVYDFTNMVLFVLSRTFFDDYYQFVNGFINIKCLGHFIDNYRYTYSLFIVNYRILSIFNDGQKKTLLTI